MLKYSNHSLFEFRLDTSNRRKAIYLPKGRKWPRKKLIFKAQLR